MNEICIIINNISRNGGAQRVVSSITKDRENSYSVFVLRLYANSYDVDHKSIFTLSFIRSLLSSNYIVLNLFPTIYLFSWLGIFKKIIILEHNTTNRRRHYKIFRYIEKFIYGFGFKLVGCSDAISKSLSDWLNAPVLTLNNCYEDNIFVSNKADSASRLLRLQEWLKGNRDLRIIMVGSFTNQKKQSAILEAMRLRSDFKLSLIGDGENRKALLSQAKLYGLENRVNFVGIVNNPEALMRTSDLMLHVADWEGFGLVALEAQGMDLPIICSNVDGLARLVSQESLLLSNDPEDILHAIENISFEKLQRIIDFGRKNRSLYTLAEYLKNLQQVFYGN